MRVIYCGKESAWQGRMFLLPRDMMGRPYRAGADLGLLGVQLWVEFLEAFFITAQLLPILFIREQAAQQPLI